MPKKAYSPEEVETLKIKIMDEASRMMSEEGIANISMRNLSAALGMTAPNIYNYFPSKHDLFLQTTLRGFDLLASYTSEASKDIEDPRLRMERVLKSSLAFARDWSGYWELIFHPPISIGKLKGTPFEESDGYLRKKAYELMTEAVGDVGTFFPEGEDQSAPIRAITAMTNVHGLIDLYNHRMLDYFGEDPDEIVDWLINASLDMILPKK